MRRQARISTGGALVVRSASALQVWLWLLIFIFQNEIKEISGTIKPGYLDFDNLPETNFTCAGKVIGGYYADLETSCQMFHVCTVGQQDEPMDIKFLCLNGTVFDQETRVCERVDEVDCTKSEKFYSLNLELYGSTAPPIIQPDEEKSEAESTEQSKQTKTPNEQNVNIAIDEITSTTHENSKTQNQSLDVADTTEDPIQEIKKDEPKISHHNRPTYQPIQVAENVELTEEYQDDDDSIYEDYPHSPPTTTHFTTTTIRTTTISTPRPITITTTTTTTTKPPTTTIFSSPSTSFRSSPTTHLFSSPSPTLSSLSPPTYSSISSTLDPSLLSPQEFIYRHRGPGSEAISFQRQSFRPADGVYITHAPPQQFDHFQYESSRTAPRPAVSRPSPFVQRPQPAPFRPTTLDPRDQLLRPGPTFQSSERHETSVKHKPYSSLPPQRPLPFNTFYYDRKRSDDSIPEDESSLSPRSVAPPTVNERPPTKPKSPPRVIVTASASVSDSNGKRLNYTVGNVVSAVKPIVQINYDDYKESDLLFDPFFLDVPKLQKRRKNRSYRKIFTVPDTATISSELAGDKTTATMAPVTSRATTTERPSTTPFTTTNTPSWNPNDYVDDNYEPHAYIPPIPPLAILVPQDRNKFRNQDRKSINDLINNSNHHNESESGQLEQPKPTSAAQTISSQNKGAGVASPATATSLSPPPPLQAPACATSRSSDCRTRA
ncbi:proteoglycan 4-like [Achroia grisella]|uniref:proteoglycan 4-like n=1 Tax=Achroia grisella TaxID=688607 RepID=UPI0027D2D75B|nr:proteoglycan 4-like [Achroia grisella]XP_059058859.1 proteoglycan 4-like [Achroia grisella]